MRLTAALQWYRACPVQCVVMRPKEWPFGCNFLENIQLFKSIKRRGFEHEVMHVSQATPSWISGLVDKGMHVASLLAPAGTSLPHPHAAFAVLARRSRRCRHAVPAFLAFAHPAPKQHDQCSLVRPSKSQGIQINSEMW